MLGGGALLFGAIGVVAPQTLARWVGSSDPGVGRELGLRDLGNALVFAAGSNRAAIMQRMLYDVSDAIQFGRRKPAVGIGALVFAGLGAVALARGDLGVPRGWTVWGALLVTGVFASALAYLVQTWAQRRTSATRTALAFTMEPVFAAIFGITLAGDRLGLLGWTGCAAIMAGILLAEPAAAEALRKVLRPA